MELSYITFMKHAQKVTKTASSGRPILKGVYHAKDGSLIVTDSHRLYLAKNAHADASESIIDPKTGEKIDGTYPDCSRLLPDKSNAEFIVSLPTKKTLDAFTTLLKANQVVGKGDERVSICERDNNRVVFTAKNLVMEASYDAGVATGKVGKLTFNTIFMADALKLFKDVGATDVEMRYYGELRPFTLSVGKNDELLVLIAPIRTVRNS
ncbi:hypothetical protein [Bacillus smithii]|uniref:hypothetical protein n=1 Tax=Bacillus smithii TaxID=1479 RepID=UPI003D1E7384